jgi:hypothetical protein
MNVAEEVTARAREHGGCDPQQRRYLLSRLAEMAEKEVVPGLLSVFHQCSDPESPQAIQEQELAGYLLLQGEHSCPLPLQDALLMLLDGWNVSVEEVPWYLVREFGQDAVRSCISSLLESHVTERHQRALRTLYFWVRNFEPRQREL